MRIKSFFAAFAVAASVAGVLSAPTAAQAETKEDNWVQQDTEFGFCSAQVSLYTTNGKQYASGGFTNTWSGQDCYGWLERSTNGGNSWSLVSGVHLLTPPFKETYDNTGLYYDGPGYLARACFHFGFTGAAHHCTNGV